MPEERCGQSTILAQSRGRNCEWGEVTREVVFEQGLRMRRALTSGERREKTFPGQWIIRANAQAEMSGRLRCYWRMV